MASSHGGAGTLPRRAAVAFVTLVLSVAWPHTSTAEPAADDQGRSEGKNEVTVLPVVGGSSDVGLGGGYVASLARLRPGLEPYLYRAESAGAITFKPGGDGLAVPYIDQYLLLELPHVIRDQLRFSIRASFTREANLKYYGIGNAASIPSGADPNASEFEYLRTHPSLRFEAEHRLAEVLFLIWGFSYTHNWLDIPDNGVLARDQSELGEELGPSTRHGSALFAYGIGFDTRDDEIDPKRGLYSTVRADVGPGGTGEIPRRWARVDGATRHYVPLLPSHLTFASRLVVSTLFGSPPFYELSRFEHTYAVGGNRGVRGVPAQRYHGKLKIFGNLELRARLFDFRAFGKKNGFGLAAFADGGRVWADYRANPELDGRGLGLKLGLGGGLRLRGGESFVLRADVAWSPDANPVGGYLKSGHAF